MRILIGNIVAFIASCVMVYAGTIEEKKKILFVQIIEISIFIVSQLILGGISGAIMNVISIIGNLLCYLDRLKLIPKILITISSVIVVTIFNVQGAIGILPLIAILTYLWLMNLKSVTKFKLLIIFVMILWIVYDFSIKSYTSTAFDVITVISNMIAIIKIQIAKKKGIEISYEKKGVV